MPPAKNTADIAAADQAPLRGGRGEKFTATSVSAERPTSTSPSYSSKPFLVTSTSWRPGATSWRQGVSQTGLPSTSSLPPRLCLPATLIQPFCTFSMLIMWVVAVPGATSMSLRTTA